MQRVGIKELRRRPRHYLARMVAGERFEVTYFGRPIADVGGLSYRAVPVGTRALIGGDVLPLAVLEGDLRD